MIKHHSIVASLNFPHSNDSVIRLTTGNDMKSLHRQRKGVLQLDPAIFRNLKGPTDGIVRQVIKRFPRLMTKLNPEWRIAGAGYISKTVDNGFIRSHSRRAGH